MELSCDMLLEAIKDLFLMKFSSEHIKYIMDQRQTCTPKPAIMPQRCGSDAIV